MMQRKTIVHFVILVILVCFGVLSAGLTGLQEDDVHLIVPTVAEQGTDITMYCNFDSKSLSFDSIKWYKGRREFFRYTPKERPAKKVLPMGTLQVDENQSDKHKVVLRNIPVGLTGNISCEVTTDPDYRSIQKYQYLTVIAHAELPPRLSVSPSQNRYLHIGDTLNLRCSSGPSKPAANYTFYINNMTYMDSTFYPYPPEPVANVTGDKNVVFEMGKADIRVTLTENNFVDNKIRIQCAAGILGISRLSNVFEGDLDAPSKPVTSHGYGLGYGGHNSGIMISPSGIRVVILVFFFLSLLSSHSHRHQPPHPHSTNTLLNNN